MKEIVQVGDDVLRAKAEEVSVREITGEKIQGILKDMRDALLAEPDGAALAAPQIGVLLRIFVLAEHVFGAESGHEASGKDKHFIYINPIITKHSKKRIDMDEGCLSVRGRYGTTERYANATIVAYDENGKMFTRGAGGLLAQAFQHECDHLEGSLFIDGAKEVWEVEITEKGPEK